MKLIELSNGDWIRPDVVISIRKAEKCTAYNGNIIKDRYIIDYGEGDRGHINSIIIYCDDMEQVETEVRYLGELINDASKKEEN